MIGRLGYALDATHKLAIGLRQAMEDFPRALLELEQRFPDEESCRLYVTSIRWPSGFVCPYCGATGAWLTARGSLVCHSCRRHVSVLTGTIFEHSKVPLTVWFRAMWQVACHKHGISALGLQRELGIGSYRTSWMLLHKIRRAMVRPGREGLSGTVEFGYLKWRLQSRGADGTPAHSLWIGVCAEAFPERERAIGKVRLGRLPDTSEAALSAFVAEAVQPGATLVTGAAGLPESFEGYERLVIEPRGRRDEDPHLPPRVLQVTSLLRRWLMGTHHGAVAEAHLDDYLNEFVFRFNRRWSNPRGKLFYRLMEQAVVVKPTPYKNLAPLEVAAVARRTYPIDSVDGPD